MVRALSELRVVLMCEVLSSNACWPATSSTTSTASRSARTTSPSSPCGLDRDSALIADTFDEHDPAVNALISRARQACKARSKYGGICGQGPSGHPDGLLDQGIESMSLNPDTVVDT